MGDLTKGGVSRLLLSQHLIGRGPECALRLPGGYVSSQHALIRWEANAWELIDRGSRNGTKLNGSPVEPGRPYPLTQGATLSFGHPDETWVLSDASEPVAVALCLDDGKLVPGRSGLMPLPTPEQPECTAFRDQDGSWRIERADGGLQLLADGETLEVAGRRFRFFLPLSSTATAAVTGAETETPGLHFSVSSDEEYVELCLDYPGRRVSLGARGHNYLLLTLARTYLDDAAAGLAPESCGWTDKDTLATALRMSPEQIDGEVYRVRKHLARHGLKETLTMIERRPRAKQLRLGIRDVSIERK